MVEDRAAQGRYAPRVTSDQEYRNEIMGLHWARGIERPGWQRAPDQTAGSRATGGYCMRRARRNIPMSWRVVP
jgi:hypothetical protein